MHPKTPGEVMEKPKHAPTQSGHLRNIPCGNQTELSEKYEKTVILL